MSESEVTRMKQDLDAIHQALGFESHIGWDDAVLAVAIGLIGSMIALSAAFGMTIPAHPHLIRNVGFTLVVILGLWFTLRRYQNKQDRPSRWRETRKGLLVSAIFAPAVLVFRWWAIHQGLSYAAIGSAIVFSIGVMCLITAVYDRGRLYYAGLAVPAMVIGIIYPRVIDHVRHSDLIPGLLIASMGVLVGGIMAWQITRKDRSRRHG
ncbi:MAG: hypothetical protein ABFD69_00965 [Candidatus Sumerlaeia bacterium]